LLLLFLRSSFCSGRSLEHSLRIAEVEEIFRYITKGSYGKKSVRNIGWVKKMNDAFPDDEFTYVSYQKVPAGGLWVFNNKNEIIVASKKYPNMKVTVGWNDDHTKVVTDYNYFRYKDDLAEYYKNKMSQYFTPDEMEVTYLIYFENKTLIYENKDVD
jgi:hypothetical protein